MTCPKCGQKPKAIKTEEATDGHARLLECNDHGRFWSLERLWKWVVKVAPNGSPTAPQRLGNGSPTATAVEIANGGDKEGVPSVLSIDLSVSDPIRNRSKSPERARALKKGRPSTNDYAPDFDEFWGALSMRRGNKKPAFEAWVKAKVKLGVKFPEVKFIITRYNRWAETRQWQEGCALYVSTWINAHGWETEPEAHEFTVRGRTAPARSDGNIEVLGDFLARGQG